MATSTCNKCGKTMDETSFYTYKDGTKTELCKKCLTMHVDNFDPETFLWLLEKMDVPYIESEWNVLRDKAFAKNPYKLNGMSVFGKYLSKMKLKQWKDYVWADTEKIKALQEERKHIVQMTPEEVERHERELKEKLEQGSISEAEYKTLASVDEQNKALMTEYPIPVQMPTTNGGGANNPYQSSNFIAEEDMIDLGKDLTQEDKLHLALKWGRLYQPSEWVLLEKNYLEYEKSFDLHNADLKRGTLQLCKLDLKGNQALDCGDLDGYAKIARASDALRKSLKFTEAQRKEERTSEFSCYGQIVAFAELHNDEDYIPPIDLSVDRDMVDKDIRDIKNWTKTLIEDDPTIYKLIEQYIKKREILAEMEEDQENSGEDGYQITDQDLVDFRNKVEEEQRLDNEGASQ